MVLRENQWVLVSACNLARKRESSIRKQLPTHTHKYLLLNIFFYLFSTGKFQLIADPVPFETVVELVQEHITHKSPSCFQNMVLISTAELPVELGIRETSLIGFEEYQGKRLLRC